MEILSSMEETSSMERLILVGRNSVSVLRRLNFDPGRRSLRPLRLHKQCAETGRHLWEEDVTYAEMSSMERRRDLENRQPDSTESLQSSSLSSRECRGRLQG